MVSRGWCPDAATCRFSISVISPSPRGDSESLLSNNNGFEYLFMEFLGFVFLPSPFTPLFEFLLYYFPYERFAESLESILIVYS